MSTIKTLTFLENSSKFLKRSLRTFPYFRSTWITYLFSQTSFALNDYMSPYTNGIGHCSQRQYRCEYEYCIFNNTDECEYAYIKRRVLHTRKIEKEGKRRTFYRPPKNAIFRFCQSRRIKKFTEFLIEVWIFSDDSTTLLVLRSQICDAFCISECNFKKWKDISESKLPIVKALFLRISWIPSWNGKCFIKVSVSVCPQTWN